MVLPQNSSVSPGKVVTIRFRMFNVDGELLDACDADDPLVYLHGSGDLAPGLERGLEGLAPGERIDVTLQPEEAFGHPDPEAVQELERSDFPADAELEVGAVFGAYDDNDDEMVIFVTAIDGDRITVSGNHPLAGATLRYEAEVLSVRDARPEELEHGHPHEDGDCDHS